MKTLTTNIVLAAMLLTTAVASAQTGSQVVKLYMTENSNMPSQAPALLTFKFMNGGNDSLQFPDQGNQGTLGQYSDEVFPFSMTADSQVVTNYDCRSIMTSYRTIPVGFATKNAGDIKVFATTYTSDPAVPAPAYVWLEQLSTGERYNVLDTAKFSIAANPNFASDFVLHIGPPCITTSTPETCYGYGNGTIHVAGPNYSNFSYELHMNNIQLVNTTVTGLDTTITDLATGNYVSVVRINGIPVDSSVIFVGGASPVIADFITDYNFVEPGDTVNFTDMSIGATNYKWTFGDGDSTFTVGNEFHQYNSLGTFQVQLDVTDANGCESSTYDVITVQSPQMMNNPFNNNTPSSFNGGGHSGNSYTSNPTTPESDIYASGDRLTIASESQISTVNVIAANGAVIYSGAQNENRTEYSLPVAGVYVVTITYANGTAESKTIVAQ